MSKIHPEKNCALLALAIVYGIVAVLQFFADGIFSMQLYFSVAFISVLTTLCEGMKSSIKWMRVLKKESSNSVLEIQNSMKEHIAVLGQYPALFELTDQYKKSMEGMSKHLEEKPKAFRDKFLDFEERILPFVEIFEILCIAIITPLKIIPNNLLTNKVINILSLLSVAFAFWSIYMNEATSTIIDQNQEERRKFF